MVRAIAQDAYFKVEALEQLLISKGLIKEGEAEEYKQQVINQRNDDYEKRTKEYWDKIKDGDYISYSSPTCDYNCQGQVLAKSQTSFGFITIRLITTAGPRRYFKNKVNDIFHIDRPERTGFSIINTEKWTFESPPQ